MLDFSVRRENWVSEQTNLSPRVRIWIQDFLSLLLFVGLFWFLKPIFFNPFLNQHNNGYFSTQRTQNNCKPTFITRVSHHCLWHFVPSCDTILQALTLVGHSSVKTIYFTNIKIMPYISISLLVHSNGFFLFLLLNYNIISLKIFSRQLNSACGMLITYP